MEADTEIAYDSNIISNYYLNSKKGKEKSNFSKVIKFLIKAFKIIFYIFIITTIICIIKHGGLSEINQRKVLFDKILNLETLINNQQQQLNQTNIMVIRLHNKMTINNQYKIFTQIIKQKYKEEQNFFCDNFIFLSNNYFENQIKKVNVDFNNYLHKKL